MTIYNKELNVCGIVHKYVELTNNNSGEYILVIVGWQSFKEIFYPLIEKSGQNYLIFDYLGTGDNKVKPAKKILQQFKKLQIEFVKAILEKHKVTKVIGTSASTVFIASNPDLFAQQERTIYLFSPQLLKTPIDFILYSAFKFIDLLERFSNKSVYTKIVSSSFVKTKWANIVGKNSRENITIPYVIKGMKMSQKYWTTNHFYSFFNSKAHIKNKLSMLCKQNRLIYVIGKKDNLLDPVKTLNFIKKYSIPGRYSVYNVEGNHVLELEALEEVIPIINK